MLFEDVMFCEKSNFQHFSGNLNLNFMGLRTKIT